MIPLDEWQTARSRRPGSGPPWTHGVKFVLGFRNLRSGGSVEEIEASAGDRLTPGVDKEHFQPAAARHERQWSRFLTRENANLFQRNCWSSANLPQTGRARLRILRALAVVRGFTRDHPYPAHRA